MSNERIQIGEGKRPILLVSPHGYKNDDENTALLTKEIANILNAYYVINHGFERDDCVDVFKDKADCNNVTHCHEDVVREEFLDPILRFKNRILKKWPTVNMYMIHGMSNKHRLLSNDPRLDLVIGYGAGNPDSFTCASWRKNCFIHLLEENGFTVYEGKKGGPMSGWSRNNMNQLFRKWYPEEAVQTLQIEVVYEIRADKELTQLTSEYMATAMLDILDRSGFKSSKKNKEY